ncbi:MAG: PorV/PorQ family protein [Candidatus Marinimicrobia bacterium]|nr:PorV/PorQ family protein [Candidatus Neomarinimicrobiota bacterium]MCF7923143.1 PorV/PorQ family protein [Candidatus Neomarinimicrobiota bacterium]
MKKLIIITLAVGMLAQTGFTQNKMGQTGAQFLSVASDAWGGGMAEAMTIIEMRSASLLFNPAGMARMDARVDIMASQNQWIADITHNLFTMAINPAGGKYGVFGASLMTVDYGEMQGTMVWQNDKGYIDTEIIKPSAYAAGVGYAKSLSDKFAVGAQIKYIGLNYGRSVFPDEDGNADTVKSHIAFASAFDVGTIFKTGWHSLAFGMSVRNFSDEVKMEKESFQLPLTLSLGIGMDLFDLFRDSMGDQQLQIAVDALHYRSHPEQLKIGLEYRPVDLLALRTGFYTSEDENTDSFDENDLTFGLGIQQFGLEFDYAYTPKGVWNEVHRVSARFSF